MTTIDDAIALADRFRDEGLHPGAQLYVSVAGEVVCDTAIGDAAVGQPLTSDHIMLLYSAGKPFTSTAILQLAESGQLGLDDPVSRFIPAWGNGKEPCTVRHVLTHMGGFAYADSHLHDHDLSYAEVIAAIAAHPADYRPGTKAGYHPSSGWKVLGEIVRVVDGRPIDEYLHDMVFEPLGLDAAYCGVPYAEQERLGDRLCPVHWTGHVIPFRDADGSFQMVEYRIDKVHNEPWWRARVEPGGGCRAPARQLGRFYEALLRGGEGLFRSRLTVDLYTATHRSAIRDRLFFAKVPWGLGINVPGSITGTVGYRAFGHGGMASSRAFCDPVEGLVMAFVTNGLCGALDNERRMMEMTDAVYAAAAPDPKGARVTIGPRTSFST